ncbi:MAG: DUF559 domain-containing protein [Melioribacteraceae bacterium]|nr:DUF559 domain-containing protein [Melioribacteraceae bacterium]
MTTNQYIEIINTRYKSGISREHAYRRDLEDLIRELVSGVEITNEPSNVTDCGNPDYVITKGKIPIGYIEAKDIGKDLNSKQYKEQFTRYKKALENLIITDYISFQFFQNGELVHEIKIGEIENNSVKPIVENFQQFENLIQNFCTYIGQTIKSSKKLAEMMASKAKLLQNILENAVTSDEESQENTSLRDQFKTFKEILIHELTPKEFADIYSQTLAYGMFAARLHDTTLEDFTRQEAAELIPKSNPFLRKLFGYVAGPDIDERIKRTVDNLADVFRATNVEELLKNFGKSTQTNDPIIHFYETFLSEYDPKLRKARGVWYTPEPVVNFIVRAVDDILKTEFNLPDGLADTSKTKIKVPEQGSSKLVEKEVHKVQILDPATGTGTFLSEVVKLIYNNNFQSMQGAWSSYVEEHLIPRLNGFELLMASYSMAHLKLDMLLRETGYKPTRDQRFNIYLTNSLEEHHPDTGTLFSNWLSTEANDANHIKRDTPVMCVIGNPPYAVSSSNKGEWIQNLLIDYKKNLNERNIQPLSDDYIKFIRFGQHFIEKNGEGILAYISNNSFIDGIIHRQMRKNLLETFDKIYVLNLHGNSKKKETSLDGSQDQNVFDIMQGVSINLFIKKTKSKKLGQVFRYDLLGKRDTKYNFLSENSIDSIDWTKLKNREPEFFFVKKNWGVSDEYMKGIKLSKLFEQNNAGLATEFDDFVIKDSLQESETLLNDLKILSASEIISKYNLKNKKTNKVENAIKDIQINNPITTTIDYRPFDFRYTVYTGVSNGIMGRPRHRIMKHMLENNLALLTCRQQTSFDFQHVFISNKISERCSVSLQTGEVNYILPLYLYPDAETDGVFTEEGRRPNLNQEIVNQISEKLGLKFVPEKETNSPKANKNSPPLEGCPENLRDGVAEKATTLTTINATQIKRNFVENLPYNPKLKKLAREKRQEGILSEVLFWQQVHKRKFHNIDFDRQRIIGNYIVDFYVKTLGLVVEIDGSSHDNKKEYDAEREQYLESLGLVVYRITDIGVKRNLDAVMGELERFVVGKFGVSTTPSRKLSGHPSKGGELLGEFAPIDLLDYIYAVLHSPTYREKYKEFLKIDFPRVPYPKDKETFWKLVKLGCEIRELHLLESTKVNEFITSYPMDGDNKITRKLNKNDWELFDEEKQLGRIWINDEQYFDNIPLIAWEFYIGGYQPAQKWLKDRRGRELNFEDILHYQKIIVSLFETDRLMKEIDFVGVE